MFPYRAVCLFLLAALAAAGQDSVRPKDVRETAKAGVSAIPKLQQYLKHPSSEIRLEAVKQIVDIGTQHSLDALVLAASDNDAEVQIRATDGLVNFYLPGYVRTGLTASLRRVGTGIKGRFTDTNDQVIDPFIQVRPDIVTALGKLARGGSGMDARANAARAIGVLRGKAAVPDLLAALQSKDSTVMYECLVALSKIGDESAGPRIAFLLRDLDPRVQMAAIETSGLLRNAAAAPAIIDVMNRTRDAKVRRKALSALAMLPGDKNRAVFAQYLHDRDDKLRAAAAEGYARLRNPADLPVIEKAWHEETKSEPRLSMAFAMVSLGRTERTELSPLQYLINSLNSSAYRDVAYPFLVELAREEKVRNELYQPMLSGTKDERIRLARVMAASGDKNSVAQLEKLSRDPDTEVAQEGLRAMRNLQARL